MDKGDFREDVPDQINYGEEFNAVLDCSYEILEHVSTPLSLIRDSSLKLRKTPKRIGFLGYKSNPSYEALKSEISIDTKKLEGTAERILKEFNQKNKKDIRLTSRESVISDSYSCSIGMDVGKSSICGSVWTPSFPIGISLRETFKARPSYFLSSLKNLEDIASTSLKIEEYNYTPEYKSMFLSYMLSDKNLAEIIEGLNEGMIAELKLRERGNEQNFLSTVVFKPKGMTEVKVEYKSDKVPVKKKKEWLEKNVNTLAGYKLPKSVQAIK